MRKSVKNWITLAIAGLLFASLSQPALANDEQCFEAVAEKHYERLSTVCMDLPHRNRLRKMQLLMSGEYSHYLGSINKPSNAFKLLKKFAKEDDMQAQYMYGMLYTTVHVASDLSWPNHIGNNGKITMEAYNSKVKAEAIFWTQKAADNGHPLAMLEVAESVLLKSFTDESVDLRPALVMAQQAKKGNPRMADNLIDRIRSRMRELGS